MTPLPSETTSIVPLRYPLVLGITTLLFVARVLGQALAAFGEVGFLPPFERWYSGLMPYRLLLPVQISMIAVMLKVIHDFARGAGFFVELRPRTGTILMWLSYVYPLAIAVRYVVTMTLHPELRWFTGTIPIWFHFVLAAFLYTLGRYQTRRASLTGEGEP